MLNAIGRRRALAGAAGCLWASQARSALPGIPDQPGLMVAGPQGGRADRWAEAMATALGRALQQPEPLRRENVGGADGVTAANQFEARAIPDGGTALLVPGSAAISWLAGDTRVKFDASRWVPVWAGCRSAALASRVPLRAGRSLRVGVNGLVGPDLAALLALDLMGVEAVPIAIETIGPSVADRPDVDAVLLRGAGLHTGSELLAAKGWTLMFGLGAPGVDGAVVRDPNLPDVPIVQELVTSLRPELAPELIPALGAVAAAVQLDLALVLPQLSPAAAVAWWRRGCNAIRQSPDLQAEAARDLTRPLTAPLAASCTAAVAVDVQVLLQLRRWLAERYHWRPT